MFRKLIVASSVALISFGASAVESSSWIDGLINTGAGLTSGKLDTRYTFEAISGTATGTDGYGVVAKSAGLNAIYGVWLDNTAASKWLTPTANARQSYDDSTAGLYKWSLSFDLTGLDLSSASFGGRWAADNDGYVQLNGSTISNGSTFSSWTDFSADAGFVAGINTLDFFVINTVQRTGNATGVRVEFLDSYAIAAVPEPMPASLALAGLVVVGFIARRRMS